MMTSSELDLIIERDVAVPMRDGTLLRMDVYRPSQQGRPIETPAPAILVRTTYDKERAQDTRDAAQFVRNGYVFVVQDVRGRYTSDGCFYHGIYETDDGRDTIDWIARQPWSNGKVGMTGIGILVATPEAQEELGIRHGRQAGDAVGRARAQARSARSPNVWDRLERSQLPGDRLDDLLASVPHVAVPEARGAVEVAPAGRVEHVHALATGDHELVAGDSGHVGERVPVRALVAHVPS